MTKLTRKVKRETVTAGIFSQGQHRSVIISIEPPNVIGFRLKGTKRTYYLGAEGLYYRAVQAYLAAEKKAKAEARKAKRKAKS